MRQQELPIKTLKEVQEAHRLNTKKVKLTVRKPQYAGFIPFHAVGLWESCLTSLGINSLG